MHGGALLGAAVANNALWCDAVCRSHGHRGVFSARLWISARHDLEFYPNAISLFPDVTTPEVMAAREPSSRYAVKDSFARLDLAAEGLTPLFEAEWIAYGPAPAGPGDPGLCWDAVADARELSMWERAWTRRERADRPLFRAGLLGDPRCAVLACRREGNLIAGVITYAAGEVTGIVNLFGAGLAAGQLWPSALRAVAARRPGPAHRRLRARHRPGSCPARRMPGPRPAPRPGTQSCTVMALQTGRCAGTPRVPRRRQGRYNSNAIGARCGQAARPGWPARDGGAVAVTASLSRTGRGRGA